MFHNKKVANCKLKTTIFMAKKDTTTPSSCINKEPFVELDPNGKASILNYNLPQSTCYRVISNIGLELPESIFGTVNPPRDIFWELAEKLTREEWTIRLKDEMQFASKEPIFNNQEVLLKEGVIQLENDRKAIERLQILKEAKQLDNIKIETEQYVTDPKIAGVTVDDIVDKIKKGFKPVLRRNIFGTVQLIFISRPRKPTPKITITLKLKMCSYLGDYGAGRTIKTFSLLPGEKTTISIRNWDYNETTKKEASSVLDSLSESSANELQTIINNEFSNTISTGTSQTSGNDFNGGINATIPVVDIGVSAGGGFSNSNTFSSAVEMAVSTLVGSTSTQVSKADSLRQVEINTETTSISASEREESIVRILENINKSRVLNFVFRQLLQEYFTITYLEDVAITYSTGYKEDYKSVNLAGLEGLLNQVIPNQDDRIKVLGLIINRLSNIVDYTGTKHSFIECVEEELSSDLECSCLPPIPAEKTCYLRKKKGLSQTYKDKTVDGIILNVTHRIVRTPALVVDALLGQGEALDCYNMHLQDESVKEAQLHNIALQQQIGIIDNISNNQKKAELYKKVFGDCCDVPQVGCTCGCGGDCNCNKNNSETPPSE